MKMLFRRVPTFVAIAAVFLGGIVIGRQSLTTDVGAPRSDATSSTEGLPHPLKASQIREVWDVLHEKFAGTLDDADLAVGALRGLASGTGDPYTSYSDPEESRQFESDLSGSFTGVGIEIGLRRGLVTVIAPLRGSPAERSGIRARDVIVKIDGVEINERSTLTEVVSKIRGPLGTTVRLTIAREGENDFLDISLRRERITIVSVALEIREGIAVISLNGFNEDTARRFRQVASELLAARAKGIVLDVRNNPGGILETAVDLAGHFLPRGTLVVTEVPKEGASRTDHLTDGPSDLLSLPTVVLMNGGSASAAEILAAALHEQRDIPLVGDQTFGKGSVQELVELSDAATLRVTIARWHTPNNAEIGDNGIAPTVNVEDQKPEEDPDEIMDKGIELLKQKLAGSR